MPASVGTPPAAESVDGAACIRQSKTAAAAAAAVVVKAWIDRDESVVVIAANTENADGPAVSVAYTVATPTSVNGAHQLQVFHHHL